jgi:hypothetical protein
MNIHQILTESRNQYLYEGLNTSEKHSVMLWESAGYAIKEAALTADQIQQLFTSIEQGATAGGSNRTLLGKGKDVASAVKTAYDDLVSKVQNSGPIKNIDAKYDQAAEKLKQATGGDAGVMKYVEKYRKFAKEHPIAQGIIYSALIAAAGISGVGIGGAAALGLLKMTDKLLQGEKFSTAVGKGVGTAALAYGASKLGDLIKSGFNTSTQTGKLEWNGGTTQATLVNGKIDGTVVLNSQTINPGDPNYARAVKTIMKQAADDRMLGTGAEFSAHAGKQVKNMATKADFGSFKDSIERNTSKKLSEGQVYLVFNRVCADQLNEGPLDAIKGLAGKAVDKAKTFGKNLTTKVTADKLNSAWQKAGAPTDSNELSAFLKTQGVSDDVIASTYTALKIPTADTAASTDAPAAKKSAKIGLGQINKLLPTLRTRDLLSIQKTVVNAIASKQTAST